MDAHYTFQEPLKFSAFLRVMRKAARTTDSEFEVTYIGGHRYGGKRRKMDKLSGAIRGYIKRGYTRLLIEAQLNVPPQPRIREDTVASVDFKKNIYVEENTPLLYFIANAGIENYLDCVTEALRDSEDSMTLKRSTQSKIRRRA